MSDRTAELRALTDRLAEHDAIADAWLAKSFTDQLVVVDVREETDLPTEIVERLAEHDCYGANEVYGTDAATPSRVGAVDDAERHRFVDVRTRGDHQSYVVE